MKRFKIVLLFLLILCAFDIVVIYLKSNYVMKKQDELINDVKEKLKNNYIEEMDELDMQDVDNDIQNIQTDSISENNIIRDNFIGLMIIPSIDVEAPIYEGTSPKVLRYAIRTF